MAWAVARRSPVTMATPISMSPNRRTVPSAPGRTRSETATTPTRSPSRLTTNAVRLRADNRSTRSSRSSGRPSGRLTATSCPPTTADAPAPGSILCPVLGGMSMDRSLAPSTTARATGCSEPDSAAAARARTSSSANPASGITSVSLMAPSVTVPVLSSRTISAACAVSKTSPPLNRMPSSAARPVPGDDRGGRGQTERTGHAINRTATAYSSACPGSALARPSQPANVATAMSITTGTKIDETRSASPGPAPSSPGPTPTAGRSRRASCSTPTLVTNTTSRPWPLIDAPTTSLPG